MKIFLKDIVEIWHSGIISIEVESADTIVVVKSKIQFKHGIPVENQRLDFGRTNLQDNITLEEYNIQPLTTLDIRYQDGQSKIQEDGWETFASEAQNLFRKEMQKKKVSYIKLEEEKSVVLKIIVNIETELQHIAADAEDDLKELDCTEQDIIASQSEIYRKKQELRKLEAKVNKDLKKKRELRSSISLKQTNVEKRRIEIMDLNRHIEDLEKDMNQLFLAEAGEKNLIDENKKIREETSTRRSFLEKNLVDENKKIREETSTLRSFLLQAISKQESLLQCPVCFDLACPPIYKCPKEHLVCCKCLPRINDKCPICRDLISGTDRVFRLAEENYNELLKAKAKLEEL